MTKLITLLPAYKKSFCSKVLDTVCELLLGESLVDIFYLNVENVFGKSL